jgi:hypothetical protein
MFCISCDETFLLFQIHFNAHQRAGGRIQFKTHQRTGDRIHFNTRQGGNRIHFNTRQRGDRIHFNTRQKTEDQISQEEATLIAINMQQSDRDWISKKEETPLRISIIRNIGNQVSMTTQGHLSMRERSWNMRIIYLCPWIIEESKYS